MQSCLKQLCAAEGLNLEMLCIDMLGNIFADFTWEVLTLTSAMQLSFVLLEQPEDLGAMAYGPHVGERPASTWQWPAFADIMAKPDWKTFAFHQGNSGAGYPKPTRLLVFAKERFTFPSFCYEGPPSFDAKGFYLALPMAKGMGSIRNRQSQGPFKTSGTEMWPAKMCQVDLLHATFILGILCYDSFEGCARYPVERGE